MTADESPGLVLRWSPRYQPTWDTTPDAYVKAGVVAPEHTRRLLRADDAALGMKAYIGVRHSDPARYGLPGEPHACFFLSVLLGKRTLFLRSHSTIPAALDELRAAHGELRDRYGAAR